MEFNSIFACNFSLIPVTLVVIPFCHFSSLQAKMSALGAFNGLRGYEEVRGEGENWFKGMTEQPRNPEARRTGSVFSEIDNLTF